MKNVKVANWEQFFDFLVGSEEGGQFMEQHPGLADRWLQAFHVWTEGLAVAASASAAGDGPPAASRPMIPETEGDGYAGSTF